MTEPTMTELIKIEHRRADLQRLDSGLDGCGCSDCQELYREIDLSKYGGRVVRTNDIILIKEKQQVADHWTEDGQYFVHYGRRWAVNKQGQRICLDPPGQPLQSPSEASPDKQQGVAKVVPDSLIPEPIMQQEKGSKGRPQKEDNEQVNRSTLWRRQQKQQQAALL